jgi:hypothetical protein
MTPGPPAASPSLCGQWIFASCGLSGQGWVDFHELAAAQEADQDKLLACQTGITGLKLRKIPLWGWSWSATLNNLV